LEAGSVYPTVALVLPPKATVAGMARRLETPASERIAFSGEVWTDARGYATVRLPGAVGRLLPPVEYELRDLEPPTTARVTAELDDGRFTIATDEPHVKVAWRIEGRPAAGQPRHRQQEEE
jgi:hypothetical protein